MLVFHHCNNAAEMWDVDGALLLRKLQQCSFCNLVAIVDAAERFWASPDKTGLDGFSVDGLRPTVELIVGRIAICD